MTPRTRKLRLTYTTGMVLEAIAGGHRYGFEIMDVSGLPDGTVYPALRRLEEAGMLASAWEEQGVATDARRPARRYYELTGAGERMLAEARDRFPALQWSATATREG